jgi:molybdopterin molybdotransferase
MTRADAIAGGAPIGRPRERARLDDVLAWIDAWAVPLAPQTIALDGTAVGRVLAASVDNGVDLPPFDRAATDGYALRADETVGASAYNPLSFRLRLASAEAVDRGHAVAVASGDPIPPGADAIVRPEQAVPDTAGTVAVVAPVFTGHEVERRGSHAERGSILVAAGRRLGPSEIGLLASAGMGRVAVVAAPRLRCLVTASQVLEAGRPLAAGAAYDANTPMLAALIERDGGVVADMRRIGRDREALRAALAATGAPGAPGADVVLVAGGTGPGGNDEAAAALAEAGELALHGVALRPGDSAGAGRASGVPVFLLPGAPAACLWAYELLAGRAIRGLAGLGAGLPFETRTLRTARKVVSEIGMAEVCPVRCTGEGEVEPMVSFAEAGLSAAAEADGFVLVPEASEGYPQGAPLTVYLYPGRGRTQAK